MKFESNWKMAVGLSELAAETAFNAGTVICSCSLSVKDTIPLVMFWGEMGWMGFWVDVNIVRCFCQYSQVLLSTSGIVRPSWSKCQTVKASDLRLEVKIVLLSILTRRFHTLFWSLLVFC